MKLLGGIFNSSSKRIGAQERLQPMPYYYFEAVTSEGKVSKKILRARDKKDADRQIRNSGLHPVLIENARVTQKRKQQRQVGARRAIKRTLLMVAAVSLVGGVAAYLVLLDLTTVERFDVKTLSRSGIVSGTSSIINAKTQEERSFAREIFGIWEMNYPDSISGIEIKHKGLMLLSVKFAKDRFRPEELRSLTETLNRAFERRFHSPNSIVLIVHEDETLAESRFMGNEVRTIVY